MDKFPDAVDSSTAAVSVGLVCYAVIWTVAAEVLLAPKQTMRGVGDGHHTASSRFSRITDLLTADLRAHVGSGDGKGLM
ncbi:hypothetical protein Y1Q_0005753 [Alligator mississippiensis]|uniref:Uncharacterized protein n=1 Tax=Alligator mississippiensis TaxID=8496 RepID=A0A151MFS6_ALLMI|nr:hypothetical protein Y1Q_0005753 [Alligator mississippiensis]